jgi:cytosolic iron-sulfur protein assembly protein CIAO1
VWQFDFSPCGNYIVSCSEDRSLIIWHEGKVLFKITEAHERSIYSVSWSGEFIASAGADNQLKIFKVELESKSFALVKEIDAHTEDINCVAFSPVDPNVLATCSDDMEIKLWKLN